MTSYSTSMGYYNCPLYSVGEIIHPFPNNDQLFNINGLLLLCNQIFMEDN